jgi:serine/threonine protein kinase
MGIDWGEFDKLDRKKQFEKIDSTLSQMDDAERRRVVLENFPEFQKRFMFTNKYVLIGTLPEGFYKKGYAAIDLLTREIVAVLILKPEVISRGHIHSELSVPNIFFNENRASFNLRHPNLIQFYDSNITDDGQAYIAFKLEEAVSIEDAIRINSEHGKDRYAKSLAINFMLQISKALEYMHNEGYIHGDVKASNILVNKEGIAKLGDFGTARKIGDPTKILGSLSYTAPEVLKGEPATPASDVFSLGVLGYHMKYGELPFKVEPEDWPDGLVEKILTVEPEIHQNHRFLRAFLEKNPKKRLKDGAACRRVLKWLHESYQSNRTLFDLFHLPYILLERFIYYNDLEFLGGKS